MKIAGSVALVTGGASGLGLATVRRLHDAGASVVILDLPSSNGTTVAKELGARAAFAAGDVTSPDDVTAALDAAQALADGPPRILVNCAGIGNAARTAGKDGPFPLDAFTRVIQVNLIGTFNAIRLTAFRMSQARRGRRRAGRDREHRVGGGVRRPDRPGRLLRVQGRHRRHDPADRQGPGPAEDPGDDDRAGPVRRRRCSAACPRSRSRR